MKIDKILFAGLGGAGQRHLRIFRELLPEQTVFMAFRAKSSTPLLNPDFSVSEHQDFESKYGIKQYGTKEEAFEQKPDLIVISTPTSKHYDLALQAANNKVHIFIEKPFSHRLDGFDAFRKTIHKNQLLFFISYQRRFHKLIKQTKHILDSGKLGKIVSSAINVASYVPNWHPYEEFRDLYACKQELGGGVLLTEIHETDLCYHFFGMPNSVICSTGNHSPFNLDVEDAANMILHYNHFNVALNLNFMQQHTYRYFTINGTKGHLKCDLDNCQLDACFYSDEPGVVMKDTEYTMNHMFYSQAKFFLNDFTLSQVDSQLNAAHASLAIVEACKESMQTSTTITLQDSIS
jgi:predicted dehydrogenase